MPSVRYHTVPAFLLDRFARETETGRRVCMLEKASGRPTQVSPRDATVQKHFYSLDTEEGRDPIVEHVLGVVESKAALLGIRTLCYRRKPAADPTQDSRGRLSPLRRAWVRGNHDRRGRR
jgi:Protein of unknown function (DUF4238)